MRYDLKKKIEESFTKTIYEGFFLTRSHLFGVIFFITQKKKNAYFNEVSLYKRSIN